MKRLEDYGLLSVKASAIYLVIVQGFGYLLGMDYGFAELFIIAPLAVVFFNFWNFFSSKSCCFMDEREMDVATDAAAYAFVAAIMVISVDQGLSYSLSISQVGQASFGVFLSYFLGKTGYHRFGHRLPV